MSEQETQRLLTLNQLTREQALGVAQPEPKSRKARQARAPRDIPAREVYDATLQLLRTNGKASMSKIISTLNARPGFASSFSWATPHRVAYDYAIQQKPYPDELDGQNPIKRATLDGQDYPYPQGRPHSR